MGEYTAFSIFGHRVSIEFFHLKIDALLADKATIKVDMTLAALDRVGWYYTERLVIGRIAKMFDGAGFQICRNNITCRILIDVPVIIMTFV